MEQRPNILFIMTDQMRSDCLGCAGHPVVRTPNLDRLAAAGARFDHAYVQAPVCGPSRMSYYTGRYVHSHRSSFNNVPLPAGERTMADYLREGGYDTVAIGRTHIQPDLELIQRVCGADARNGEAVASHLLNGGFREPGPGRGDQRFMQEAYRRFRATLPAEDGFDDTVRTAGGQRLDVGDYIRHADYRSSAGPLKTRPEHMYDAFKTDQAIRFIGAPSQKPWLLFLSLDLPHPPFVIGEPYWSMYRGKPMPEPLRRDGEVEAHPIIATFRRQRRSLPLDEQATRHHVQATYYGMVSFVDDQVGRVLDAVEQAGLLERTLIIFVADHGEYMGDHWMADKELFYEQAINVPFLVRVPGRAFDPTRGKVVGSFVQAIDVVPTMLQCAGIEPAAAVQGCSVLPLLEGRKPADWRDAVFADWDYQFHQVGVDLDIAPHRRRAWMIRDSHYKYVHMLDLPPMLFDLERDPQEFCNLGSDPDHTHVVNAYRDRLLQWRMAHEDQAMAEVRWHQRGPIGDYLE